MKRVLFLLAVATALVFVGCARDTDNKKAANVGVYETKELKVVKKETNRRTGGNYYLDEQLVYMGREGGPVSPYRISQRLDENWWGNLEEGQYYKTLVETKEDGYYIWDYQRIDR